MPAADIPATAGAFTTILQAFTAQLKTGGQAIVEFQSDLCLTFFALQYLKAAAEFGLGHNIKQAIATLIGGSLWYGVAMNAVPLVDGYIQWMGSIGTMAGVSGSGANLSNPSALLDVGLTAIKGMGAATDDLSVLEAGGVLLLMCGTALATLFGYMIIGIVAVVVVIYSYAGAMVAVALFPFLIEPSTRFLAAPGVGLVVSSGLSLGLTSMVLSVGHGAMAKLSAFDAGKEMTLGMAMNVMMASGLIAVLSGGVVFIGIMIGGKVGNFTRAWQGAAKSR